MLRTIKRSILSSVVLGFCLSACGGADSDASSRDAADGVPELAAVQMGLTEDPELEGTATADDQVDPAAMADELDLVEVPDDAAEDMVSGQHAIHQLNQGLRSFLTPIVKLVRNQEPDQVIGATSIWGPIKKGDVEYRLLLRHAASGRYAWRLDARAADSKGSYSRIALGLLDRGAQARRGKGALGVDLDALGELNSDVKARGKILVGFRHGEDGTTVGYGLRDFTADPDNKAGIDAVLRGVHLKGGINRVRLAFYGDVDGSETEQEELVLARLRHLRGVGGRSDLVVLGGDIPEGQMWVRSQCWTAKLAKVFSEVQLCPLEPPIDLSTCDVLETEGDVTACDKSLRDPELPPSDPEASMPDTKDPNEDVDVPTDLDELVDPEL